MKLRKENEMIEFKLTTGELFDSVKSISAILNKHGYGTIYFGVKNNGEIVGQQVGESTERDISRVIYECIEPKIFPNIQMLEYNGKYYFKVDFAGNNQPYSAKGIYYMRMSDENRVLTRDELVVFIRTKYYSDDWESELTNYTINDVDDESLLNFYKSAKECGRLELIKYDKEELLTLLDLLKDGKLNNAGYSLFGKKTKIPLKLAIYATNEKITFIDLQVKNGNIYRLLNEAINYIHSNIHWKVEIGSRKRTEIPEIPIKAIREIVINSFAHAKYKVETEHEINIFSGRVSIYNPGSFPDNLTPLDFVNSNRSSIKRNKIIFDVLFRSKDVEKSGSGFKRVYDLCKQEKIKCEFNTDVYGFSFSFIRNNSNKFIDDELLSKHEKVILDAISENLRITRLELAQKIDRSERTVQRITNSLVEKGFIERIGNNRFGYWEVK